MLTAIASSVAATTPGSVICAANASPAGTVNASSGAPTAPALKVATPTRGDVHRFVVQPGTIRALQQTTLYAKIPGYLKSIAVDKGDTVKAGDVLAQLEVPAEWHLSQGVGHGIDQEGLRHGGSFLARRFGLKG